jgi:hypothetical protein
MTDRAGSVYRDEIAAAYARIASLEAEVRARATSSAEAELSDDERWTRLEDHARRWDRVRTTLALVLGAATLGVFHLSERCGSPVAVLFASVIMVSVGVTLAWPSLSMRAAIGARFSRAPKRDATGVRVMVSGEQDARALASYVKVECCSASSSQDWEPVRVCAAGSDRERAR